MLSQCDVFLYPSVFDCGGAVVLEAMSLGLTVVALNWGGPGDYLASGGGVLVEPVGRRQSVAELAKAVQSLTPSKRRELGEAAQRKIADHYTWPAKVRQILGVYQSVCKSRRSRSRRRFVRGRTMSTLIAISLGASCLPYASLCIRSLAENLDGDEAIHLLTDTPGDQEQLQQAFAGLGKIKVQLSDELWEDGGNPMRRYAGLEKLRKGHPCWRKLTDPMLLAREGDEVVIVDPDVYFPRRFSFEKVGDGTLRLMWQKPNCLLPFSVVQTAFAKGIAMADHVDIGIAQYRSPLDLEWLNWLVESLGEMPRVMHVEAILWSCLAMRMGGGYLDSDRWRCWANTQWKRVLQKAGATPARMLSAEDFRSCLAFHAGGTAKTWLAAPGVEESLKQLAGLPGGKPLGAATVRPFVPFTKEKFEWLRKRGRILKAMGYYKLLGGRPPG